MDEGTDVMHKRRNEWEAAYGGKNVQLLASSV
jgi:hypothetical protein